MANQEELKLVASLDIRASVRRIQEDLPDLEKRLSKKLKIGIDEKRIRDDLRAAIDGAVSAFGGKLGKMKLEFDLSGLKEATRNVQQLHSYAQKAATAIGRARAPSVDANTADFDALQRKYNELYTEISRIEQRGKALTVEETSNISQRIAALNEEVKAYNRVNEAKRDSTAPSQVSDQAVKQLLKAQKAAHSADKAYASLKKQVEAYIQANSKIKLNKSLSNEFDILTAQIDAGSESIDTLRHKFALLQNTVVGEKAKGKSFIDQMSERTLKFSSWFSISQIIMRTISQIGNMVREVKKVDSAMVELRKVTDETRMTYNQFLTEAGQRAHQIGAAISDVVSATADFARLGYNIDEASTMADAAIVYYNVGDGIRDVNEASESLISSIKAFGIEAENTMMVVDKYNEILPCLLAQKCA